MSAGLRLMASFGDPELVVDSADFDGTTNKMTRGSDLDGNADSKKGIISAWARLDGGDATFMRVFCGLINAAQNSTNVLLERTTSNKFSVVMRNVAATTILGLDSVATYVAGATWRHVLASWDLATAGARQLYINDVSDMNVLAFTNDTIDYTQADYVVGAGASTSFRFNGCIAELYFAPGQYLDFSVTANRRRFISGRGRPMWLGTDGKVPTGVIPLVYQHLADTEAVANFATNRGSGGNFTIAGTLATGSSSPSD